MVSIFTNEDNGLPKGVGISSAIISCCERTEFTLSSV